MNIATITGRLTANPELKTTLNHISVCSFTVAVKRPGEKDKTDFLNIVAWRHTADFISKYFRKGNGIEISGPVTTRQYENKNGYKQTIFEIRADTVEFAIGNKDNNLEPNIEEENPELEEFAEILDSGLPF